MQALKNIGSVLLGLAVMAGIALLGVILINGIAWVSYHIFDYVIWASNALLTICILVFIPLALFRTTRIVSVYGFYISSFIFGLCVWIYGFLITLQFWGVAGIIIGLVLGFVGVVPLGIIAAAVHTEWVIVAELIFGLVLTYGTRLTAFWLAVKVDKAEAEKRSNLIDGEIVPEKRPTVRQLVKEVPPVAEVPVEISGDVFDKNPQETEWYVFVNGKQLGPAKFNDLVQLAKRGVLQKSVQLRQSESEKWVEAGDIPGLFPAAIIAELNPVPSAISVTKDDRLQVEPSNARLNTDSTQAVQSEPAPRKWKNYIARHWRGELSLPISYWINGFLGNIAAAIAIAAIGASTDLKDNFRPEIALISIILIWFAVLLVFSWQIVGVWRSATNYQRTNVKRYWGGIAKFVMIIALLRTIGEFLQTGVPEINEYYKIYAGDEEVGKYAFRVLRDGQELEFTGGITFGVAKAFKQFTDAMGNLKLVHLDSLGGRISEAQRIGDIIKARGLSTYVPHRCMSACTIIFLSGRERLISPESRIGFHQPDFPGMTAETRREAIAAEEARLRRLGVTATFAHRANLATPKDMWFPTVAELLSEHVATKVVNSFDYALSGFGQKNPTADQLNDALLANDIYASIRQVDPKSYALILEKSNSIIQRGMTQADLMREVSPIVENVFSKTLPYANDGDLLAYVNFFVKELVTFNRSGPSECYFMINPNSASPSIILAIRNRHEDLTAEELKLKSNVIRNYSKNITIPTVDEIRPLRTRIIATLQQRRDFDVSILSENEIVPAKYSQYCNAMIALYAEALNLPQKDSVSILRYMFSLN